MKNVNLNLNYNFKMYYIFAQPSYLFHIVQNSMHQYANKITTDPVKYIWFHFSVFL